MIRITTTPKGIGTGSTHCSSQAFPTTSSPVKFTISSAAVQVLSLVSSSTLAAPIRYNLFLLQFESSGHVFEIGSCFFKEKNQFLFGSLENGRREEERRFAFFLLEFGNCVVGTGLVFPSWEH